MKKVFSLFDEFGAALQFPYYFGENWNAFDECITDLEWMPADAYVLIITEAGKVLSEDSEDQLEALTSFLEDAGKVWSQPVELSEAWDRPAKGFHVIFQCDKSDKQAFTRRLETVGASFQEMLITSKND